MMDDIYIYIIVVVIYEYVYIYIIMYIYVKNRYHLIWISLYILWCMYGVYGYSYIYHKP